jgi:hypothetical protein
VKDVRDEVNMIENVLQSQLEVFELVSNFFNPKRDPQQSTTYLHSGTENLWRQLPYDETIRNLLRQWKRLDEDAEKVEKSV